MTVEGVRSALAEFGRVGRGAFLERYGFREAREYFLVVDGNEYDSKAIVGAAHGYDRPDLGPLPADAFSGGAAGAAGHLEHLGFDVVVRASGSGQNPTWAAEELIVALDLYLRFGLLDARSSAVIAASAALNRLTIHSDRPDAIRFRNPNGVAMKLANFASLDPDYNGSGLPRHGRRDAELWNRYNGDADAVATAAAQVLEGAALADLDLPETRHDPIRLPVQEVRTKTFIRKTASELAAERREGQLVRRYDTHLVAAGRKTSRHRYQGGFECDLFDETASVLYEAKSNTLRQSIRLAVGQLLDYRRLEHQHDPRLAVLLPRRPSDDSLTYLHCVEIDAVWETAAGFSTTTWNGQPSDAYPSA